VYVAGLRFWARRTVHHRAGASLLSTIRPSIASRLCEALWSPRVDHNLKRIIAETERYRITGMLRLPPDGYRSRLSDYLNSPDRAFLAMTDVEVEAVGGDGTVERYPFIALSLRHVVVAMPADEASE
jgi:hypothetical protein